MIDGFTEGRIPPKDQIQEVRINNNPFSAEFSGVGFTRTEILTKTGTGEFHGVANFLFRDAVLNARNPFALTRQSSDKATITIERFLSRAPCGRNEPRKTGISGMR